MKSIDEEDLACLQTRCYNLIRNLLSLNCLENRSALLYQSVSLSKAEREFKGIESPITVDV